MGANMRRSVVVAGAVLALLSLCGASPYPNADASIERQCDLLASSPYDADRPEGVPGVAPGNIDTKLAIPACRAALAEHPDSARAAYQLARALHKKGSLAAYEEAAKLYRRTADAGNALAAHNLGAMYDNGQGVAKDYLVALELYEKAAVKGFAQSMVSIGLHYGSGQGVEKNVTTAREWYEKAVAAGEASAKDYLKKIDDKGRQR